MSNILAVTLPGSNKRPHPGFSTGLSPNLKQRQTVPQEVPYRKWSPAEDDAVRQYVESTGGKENVDWLKCSEVLQEKTHVHRSGSACRHRFNNTNHPSCRRQLARLGPGNTGPNINKPAVTPGPPTPSHAPIRKVIAVYTKPHTSCASIQTDVTFSPSDKVIWASTSAKSDSRVAQQATPHQVLEQTPSLRSLLVPSSMQLSSEVTTSTPKWTNVDLARRLFSTPTETLSTQAHDRNTAASQDTVYPESVGNESEITPRFRPEGTEPTMLPLITNIQDAENDHTYEKKEKKNHCRRKCQKNEKPEVTEMRKELLLVDRVPPLTLKHQACLALGLKNETSADQVAMSVMSIPPVRDAVVNQLSQELAVRPETLKNRKNGELSVLMRKDYDNLKETKFIDIIEEFREKFPELFQIVLAITSGRKDLTSESMSVLIPRLAMIYSILMQTRNPQLGRLQHVLTMALADQIVSQKVYDRLNVLGVTMSYPRSLAMVKVVGAHFKDQLVSAVKEGNHLRLIGDNLNFNQGVGYENIDRHKHMVHMFASCALITEPVYTEKSNAPEIPLRDLTVNDITFSAEEYATMRTDMVVVVAEILSTYLPQLRDLFKCLPKQFVQHHEEYGRKTGVIPLPVLDLNEQFDKDTTKILEFYQGLVSELPLPTTEPVHIGGDQLTRERFGTALKLRIGNLPHGRFAHLGPATFEFFHLGMNYLEKMVFDTLWCPGREDELGSLQGEKERIFRKSVDPDVAKAYEADKHFFTNYVNAHLVEAALDYFGIENRNDFPVKHQPPQDASGDDREAWLYKVLGDIIDQYCFPYWSGHDREVYVSAGTTDELHQMDVKLKSGQTRKITIRRKTTTLKPEAPDKKKIHAHYILETGMTFLYFLDLVKTPDRSRLLGLFKLMMLQLKGRNTHAKYPLELLLMLMQQYSLLSERRAHQVLHACFVNTKGRPNSNIPADLQMEWIVKQNKQHIKNMVSNKTVDNIFAKSSALPGLHMIASNYDAEANVVLRSKSHNPKDIHKDEIQIMDDLRRVRPFQCQPGRAYRSPHLSHVPISQAKKLNTVKFNDWFAKHKKAQQ